MNAIRQMTYLENWLNESVFYPKKDEQPGAEYGFSRERLLELFTNCHEDLELELNRAQSELKEDNAAIKYLLDFVPTLMGGEINEFDEHGKAIKRALRELDK